MSVCGKIFSILAISLTLPIFEQNCFMLVVHPSVKSFFACEVFPAFVQTFVLNLNYIKGVSTFAFAKTGMERKKKKIGLLLIYLSGVVGIHSPLEFYLSIDLCLSIFKVEFEECFLD